MYQKIGLTSKKNKVYRIKENDTSYILKIFTKIESMDNEIEMLRLLNNKDMLVPKVLKTSKDSIVLEDLGETTLLSIYEELEKSKSNNYQDIIKNLLSWLEGFYKISGTYYGKECILFDMNFRNFILKKGQVYRIDFEEVTFGNKESDLGKLLAFGLTYKPEQTEWKKKFGEACIREIKKSGFYDIERVEEEKTNELARIRMRR